ncbi:Csu type fimbrial protein [Xanthomonas theicola]|uniref:Spore coat protein U n=1 Tax=Xanthomonas theicola TaxID=56464 RepID=A0A2S6ZMA3_9XANT|nr:spore coat U domain-containing protein [Xanthomonas theicola]PPT93403.1 spore coat protein U [Xanthomonas theicola]QNH25541.1 spore coat protein U domain-containing protein [Xanthomonas theicola]
MTALRGVRAAAVLAALLLALLLPGRARADTTCTATAVGALAFGTVSATGNTDVSATFNVACNTAALSVLGATRVRMCLSIGDGSTGNGAYTPRGMTNAASDVLAYQIYTDAARTTIWGNLANTSGPGPLAWDFSYPVPVVTGGSQTFTVTLYARVPTAQTVSVGAYNSVFSSANTALNYSYNESIIGPPATPATCTAGGTGTKSATGAFPFTASAVVAPRCSAYVATDLDFGSVGGSIHRSVDSVATLSMACTNRTAWNVGLGDGLNAANGARRMKHSAGAAYINYDLYHDSARSRRWGSTVGTDVLSGIGNGNTQTLTVYGRVPTGQTPVAGSYSDTVIATITY